MAERSYAPDWEQRFKVVGSIPSSLSQEFFNPGLQKRNNMAPSVRIIVICSTHRLLWRDSYKGVDHTGYWVYTAQDYYYLQHRVIIGGKWHPILKKGLTAVIKFEIRVLNLEVVSNFSRAPYVPWFTVAMLSVCVGWRGRVELGWPEGRIDLYNTIWQKLGTTTNLL